MKNILKFTALILLISIQSCKSDKNKHTVETSQIDTTQVTTVEKNPLKTLFWGDTHLHTENSPDAFAYGNRLNAEQAYRFARGEKVMGSFGKPYQLNRPLDFLVVADHAEGFGISREILNGHPDLMKDPIMKRWKTMFEAGGKESQQAGAEMPVAIAKGTLSKEVTSPQVLGPILMKSWRSYLKTADKFNNPGTFTALIGYEWSSMPGGNNLHRVVVYKDAADKASKLLPVSALQSNNPEFLWKFMQQYQDETGGSVLAIPHNGNISNGRMFPMSDFNNNPITKAYAQLRANWEPLIEVTQIKGDSESHPFLSPNDEFASFGDSGWELGNMNGVSATNDMYEFMYARSTLKNGLKLQETLGANPYKFGMIGSTDSHTSLATADEDNWSGKFSSMENEPNRITGESKHFSKNKDIKVGAIRKDWQYLASGYAAVWAESNTREDIWDAMKRKEVYGTTGSRIQLRFFGGWDFNSDDINTANYAEIGYKKGVPMGSDLTIAETNKAPNFMIVASKDPKGANLDRVQIIKGWFKNGETFEKVYNVSWSDERVIDANGKIAAVGNTVDVTKATYTNSIGENNLATVWTDPNFDASLQAFYYVRVLEIPTPRWTTYDAVKNQLKLDKEIPLTIQERAYSSPIWYTPN